LKPRPTKRVKWRALDELEKLTHAETKKVEDLSAAKEREVMEIK